MIPHHEKMSQTKGLLAFVGISRVLCVRRVHVCTLVHVCRWADICDANENYSGARLVSEARAADRSGASATLTPNCEMTAGGGSGPPTEGASTNSAGF